MKGARSAFREDVAYKLVVLGDGKCNRWVCHYCGCPADTLDHIPPLSRYHDALGTFEAFRPVKVPSCSECNVLAGDELHVSFLERQAFVKAELRHKYARQLRVREWDEDELEEMSYQFRVSIAKDMGAKHFIRARLRFMPA